jgi:histidine triad (HIT) family protein
MQECLFCKIVSGEIPSKKIYEDDDALAFLDINPAAPGHTLIVSKKHYMNLLDVDELTLRRLINVVQRVSRRIASELKSDVMVLSNNGRASGQIVFHIHFHVVPRYEGDGIHLTHKRMQLSEEDMETMRKKLNIEKEKSSHGLGNW